MFLACWPLMSSVALVGQWAMITTSTTLIMEVTSWRAAWRTVQLGKWRFAWGNNHYEQVLPPEMRVYAYQQGKPDRHPGADQFYGDVNSSGLMNRILFDFLFCEADYSLGDTVMKEPPFCLKWLWKQNIRASFTSLTLDSVLEGAAR